MRTTLSLDDDVATKLKAEARLAGRPFREIVNETLHAVWRIGASRPTGQAFKTTVRDLGDLKPGLFLDNVAKLIEQPEGSPHR
jgi:hypothetical protein